MLAWFKRKRNSNDTKIKPIEQLANLLREHGNTILENKGRLCLTTPVLISLNQQFQKLNFSRANNRNGNSEFKVILNDESERNIALVFDFAQKSPNLKLESGPVCFPSPQLCLLPFKSLQILEIRRVPITYLRGLHHIAKHIKTLICHRSASSIKDVIYQFGRDFNGVLTLPELKTLDLSYNTINCLDQSLKLLPSLEGLDLCYNCLVDASSEFIPPIKQLNVGFNSIAHIPSYSLVVSRSLTTAILCNNSLTNLDGLEMFTNLQTLDVSSNCLISFDDLLPLARLQFLSVLTLKGNPVEFMPKYRYEVISRLCPIVRAQPVSLDGQLLNETEIHILGIFVQPAPLRSYIPPKPYGRPQGSLVNLANSVSVLSERVPIGSSTPNDVHRKHSSRRKGKVREVAILDQGASANESLTESYNASGSFSKNHIERQESFGSRRNSVDDSVLWVHKNSCGEVFEVSKSLPDIDYATQLEPEQLAIALAKESHSADEILTVNDPDESIYNKTSAKFDIDSGSTSSYSSISVDGDDDEAPVYLVESVVGGDKNAMDEKESVFVIFKHPYLIEKDPVTGQVVKLDLNYLHEVVPFPNGVLRVSLKFDLVRLDHRKRLYLFEDIDHVEEFNKFVNHLTPVALQNKRIRESNVEKYQCLKCSSKFQKFKSETSFTLCPNCKSSMVVERCSEPEMIAENTINSENKALGKDLDNHASKLGFQIASNSLTYEDSSIEVLPRVVNSIINDVSVSVEHAQTPLADKNNWSPASKDSPLAPLAEVNGILADNDSRYSLNEDEISNLTNNLTNNNLTADDERSLTDKESQSADDALENDAKVGSFKEGIGKMKSYLKNKFSGSQASLGSTGDKNVGNNSESNTRCATPSTSYESRNSQAKGTQSRTGTPMPDSSNNCFISNKDDIERCDHRLKLYFTMDLFKHESEDFRCMIQCSCVRFDKTDFEECLLLISSMHIYLFKFKPNESDTPKKWLHLIIKYGFCELKYIDYCYYNQSFRLEFERDYGSYKFIICDSERCQKFVSLLLNAIQDAINDKHAFPIVLEDPNPRTLVNIRTQIFGLKEDLTSMAKRLYTQATVYTVPPLLKSKKVRIRTHQQSVTGKELINWLVSRREAKSRLDAISVCQKFIDVGLLYHISKELQFEDGDAIYKFCFSDNNKKSSNAALQRNSVDGNDSESSQNSLDEAEINSDVCLYSLTDIRMSNEDSFLNHRSLFLTKSHLFVVTESHQWPLARIYQPPSFLKEQFKVIGRQRVIDLVKMTFFEDSPCHVLLEFIDELSDADSRETCWLILTETLREMDKLTNALKSIWEDEIKVDITTDSWPSVNLAL